MIPALVALFAIVVATPSPVHAWPVLDHSVPDEVAQFYDPSIVRNVQLTMLPSDWDMIRRDSTYTIRVPATLTIDGTPLPSPVAVRRKSGVPTPIRDPQRVAFKVYLDEYDADQEFMGVTKLSLEGATYSPVFEGLAWLLHEAASTSLGYGDGFDAALGAWVTVAVNDRPLGLYLNVEDRGKRFLKNRDTYVSGQTWLYKRDKVIAELDVGTGSSPRNSVLCFEPFADPDGPSCAMPDDATTFAILQANIDLQALLTMWAIDAFTCNWDSMLGSNNNYFWADHTYADAPLRRYYPWDMDAGFERSNCSPLAIKGNGSRRGASGQTAYEIAMLNNPFIRQAYREVYADLLGPGGPLSVASIEALITEVQLLLEPSMVADPYRATLYRRLTPTKYFAALRTYLLSRRSLVVAQLALNLPAPRAG